MFAKRRQEVFLLPKRQPLKSSAIEIDGLAGRF